MYSTIAQVRNRNTLLLNEAAVPDAVVTAAVEEADSIVDGMLGNRYPVPISPVPALIRKISADLAASALIVNVVGNRGENGEPTQGADLRENAMALLDKLVAGDMSLPEAGTAASPGRAGIKTNSYNTPRTFEGWNPSDPSTYR